MFVSLLLHYQDVRVQTCKNTIISVICLGEVTYTAGQADLITVADKVLLQRVFLRVVLISCQYNCISSMFIICAPTTDATRFLRLWVSFNTTHSTSHNIQGGARNVIPFYHPIKIVTSEYRCCKRASECCSSWKMRQMSPVCTMAENGLLTVDQKVKVVLFYAETKSVVAIQRRFSAHFGIRWAPCNRQFTDFH